MVIIHFLVIDRKCHYYELKYLVSIGLLCEFDTAILDVILEVVDKNEMYLITQQHYFPFQLIKNKLIYDSNNSLNKLYKVIYG